MTAADRRMEIISILVVSGHMTSKELAQEFSSWTATNRTAIRLPCPSRRNSWKCMPKQRAGKRKY